MVCRQASRVALRIDRMYTHCVRGPACAVVGAARRPACRSFHTFVRLSGRVCRVAGNKQGSRCIHTCNSYHTDTYRLSDNRSSVVYEVNEVCVRVRAELYPSFRHARAAMRAVQPYGDPFPRTGYSGASALTSRIPYPRFWIEFGRPAPQKIPCGMYMRYCHACVVPRRTASIFSHRMKTRGVDLAAKDAGDAHADGDGPPWPWSPPSVGLRCPNQGAQRPVPCLPTQTAEP